MRILAFDPGYERLGVAVVEKSKKEELLYSDCIRTSAKAEFSERLRQLGTVAEDLIKKWQPDAVALEEVYFEKNAKTAMQVAEVRGMLTYIAAKAGLVVHQYTPAEVKVAVTGHGQSDKRAVAAMVVRLVVLPKNPSTSLRVKRLDDEVDAIAVGLTCLASVRQ